VRFSGNGRNQRVMTPDIETNSLSLRFVETLYERYLKDPGKVPEDWRRYFEAVAAEEEFQSRFHVGPAFRPKSVFGNGVRSGGNGAAVASATDVAEFQHRVDLLLRNYRVRGHRQAKIDPLQARNKVLRELDPVYYGLLEGHMELRFRTDVLAGGGTPTLREIIQSAQNTYCRSIGVQFMHIDDMAVRDWLQTRMESTENRLELSREEQLRILTRLTDSVIFEEFIQKKFVGAKSFSLEGAETLIPLLDYAIERAGEQGVDEILIGMPHRGRLNVLANIMGKDPRKIFAEFEDSDPRRYLGGGDVKYHLGYHTDWITEKGHRVNLALAFNPSHLEFVNCVALGRLRAKNDRDMDVIGEKGMAILIHGDAAFAGEGIVQETLNLSRLEGYSTGGTLHVIVNNQIGFTTTPNQGRSTTYASDVAKMLQSPIFHVNGEDPEAVAQVVSLAMEFRHQYRRDVFIDMYCFRRRGHNEGDEPAFTQPLMYDAIRSRESVRDSYLNHLLKLGEVAKREADIIADFRRNHLEHELTVARREPQDSAPDGPRGGPENSQRPANILRGMWSRYTGGLESEAGDVATAVDAERLKGLLERLTILPEGFHLHPKLQRIFDTRREMAAGEKPLDWSAGEALALATLATEGVRIRLTGQDSERGTFSHRHSVLHDVETGKLHKVFQHLSPDQAPVDIYNSPLSEASVLGFEYGYSVGSPEGLIVWEAQFGDFVNVAQVIIDQFIATAEDKWRRLSGLVMLLPHGLEGTGPEHASARLERFLQLAAEDNIQVIYPTTPAQIFHALRRQVLRNWRKPLVVMSPKSMLRNPHAVSPMSDFTKGEFQRVLTDESVDPKKVERVVLCSGKIYYELATQREEHELENVALLRLEQIYPLPLKQLEAALKPYKSETPVIWTQEEPENMGAWHFLFVRFCNRLLDRFPFSAIVRPASASPATGSAASHRLEQQRVIRSALNIPLED